MPSSARSALRAAPMFIGTTMLRIIAGFHKPTSGRVLVDGREVKGPSSDNIFVFQQNGLLPWLTVAQNVELAVRHIHNEEVREATCRFRIWDSRLRISSAMPSHR